MPMTIRSLTIENFGPYEKAHFDLGQHNLFIGPNGAGKSTIMRTLAWILTGACHLTTANGAGFERLIRSGADEAVGVLDLQPWGVIERRRGKSHKLLLDWHDSRKLSENHVLLLNTIGLPVETILAMFDPIPVLERPADQQRAAMLRVLRPAKITVPQSLIDEGIAKISGVEAIESLITEHKTEKLRDLNRESKWLDEHPPEPAGEKPANFDLAKRQNVYDELDAKYRELTREAQTVATAIGTFEERIRRAESVGTLPTDEDVAKLTAAIADAEQKLSKAKTAQIDAANKVETGKRRQAELTGERNAKTARLQDIADRIDELKAKPSFECPADACPLLKQLAEQADTKRQSLESDQQKTEQQCDTLSAQLAEVETRLAEYETAKRQCETDAVTHETKIHQLTELAKDAERFNAIATEADVARKSLEESKAKQQQIATDLAKCEELREKQGAAIERYREWERADKAVHDWRDKVASTAAAQDRERKIVSDLEDLRRSIIGDRLEQFLRMMDEFLEPFGISKIEYTLDGGFVCQGRGADLLSDGQRAMMFEAAFKVAVATATGAGIVCLDDLAPMTDDFRYQISRRLQESGHQIIECLVGDRATAWRDSPWNATIFFLSGGAVQVVSPAA